MEQWLQFALAVPLSGGVLGLLYRVAPVPRWNWALKARLAVYRDMPNGSERDWWGAEAEKYSRLMREYKQDFPRSQKALGWIAVGYTLLLLCLDTLGTWDKAMNVQLFGVFGPVITLGTLLFWLSMCLSVFRGRTIFGLTPQEHALAVEHAKSSLGRNRFLQLVRRRMRRTFSA